MFIDEIQNVKNFETLINGYRADGGWSIFLTGSNSYLLGGELMTKLTGRYLEFEMFPLTYDEYEDMKAFYKMSDLGFYFADNTNNDINYGPVLENMVFTYARSKDCSVSVGRIGKLECDFITRNREQNYAYIQVAYTILSSKKTEDREYGPLEKITDNYPRCVVTTDSLFQKRSGIAHVNLMDFMKEGREF